MQKLSFVSALNPMAFLVSVSKNEKMIRCERGLSKLMRIKQSRRALKKQKSLAR
jgi:hypothetical protein